MKTLNQRIASFIVNDLKGIAKDKPMDTLKPEALAILMKCEHEGLITRKETREVVKMEFQ